MRWNPFYHQLPVHSPVPVQALVRAMQRRGDDTAVGELGGLLRNEYDASAAVLTGSGTEALQLALLAARRRTGETAPRLALPAFTCFDVATAAVWSGLPLLCYDIDPASLVPDLGSLEGALREGARIIVVSPLYGVPVPWEPLSALAEAYGAVLIEDAAQGQGARWRGRRLGALGEISVLSFGRGKGWTGGRGGAVLLRGRAATRDSSALMASLAPARGTGVAGAAAQWALARPQIYGIPVSLPWLGLGETRYREPVAPTMIPAAAAALALVSHRVSEWEAIARQRRARELAARLALAGARVVGINGGEAEPGFLRLPVRVTDARWVLSRLGRWGVAPSYPSSLPELGPVRERLVGGAGPWPGAATLVRELITIPTHGLACEWDHERIVRGLARVQGNSRYAMAAPEME